MRIDPAEWRALDLEVHQILADVPLKDVSAVDLPGGSDGRGLEDVRGLLDLAGAADSSGPVRALFSLRRAMGRLFHWDGAQRLEAEDSYRLRVGAKLRASSIRPAGTTDGPFALLYQLDREMLSEVRNATVHAFSVFALVDGDSGYRLYWAIYVQPVGAITAWYMRLIDPFRRFIIYPAILRRLRAVWANGPGRAA
jgi:hypothetical protein